MYICMICVDLSSTLALVVMRLRDPRTRSTTTETNSLRKTAFHKRFKKVLWRWWDAMYVCMYVYLHLHINMLCV